MANYAVRIYNPELKAWLVAEAARRGPGVRTSDVVESALQLLKASLHGSAAANHDVPSAPRNAVPSRDASDHGAVAADVVAREAVVQPVPPVDSREELVEVIGVSAVTTAKPIGRILYPEHGPRLTADPTETPTPVQRVKGPDSGQDDELGF